MAALDPQKLQGQVIQWSQGYHGMTAQVTADLSKEKLMICAITELYIL